MVVKGGNGGAGAPISVIRCADAGCASPPLTSITSEHGSAVALVMRSNGRAPVTGNSPGTAISVYDCSTTTCSRFVGRVIDADLTSGVDMAPDGADPVLAFRQFVAAGGRRLRIHRCRTNTCLDGAPRAVAGEPGEPVGNSARIAVRSDGRPGVAHYDANHDDLLLHVCANPECIGARALPVRRERVSGSVVVRESPTGRCIVSARSGQGTAVERRIKR